MCKYNATQLSAITIATVRRSSSFLTSSKGYLSLYYWLSSLKYLNVNPLFAKYSKRQSGVRDNIRHLKYQQKEKSNA